MKWSVFFSSAVGKKLVMALTGIFLVTFLVVHMGINACIFADFFDSEDNGDMFNRAAYFMGSTVLIRIIEIGLFVGFIIHIVQGFVLEAQNRSKRGRAYEVNLGNRGSKWYSRSMGLLGTILFIFLLIHWWHFWIPSRFTGGMEEVIMSNGKATHNLFKLMELTFSNVWVVILYVIACISLAWHLAHGFQSAFRTIGVHNKKYLGMLNSFGIGFSIIVPLIFALMPVAMYLGWVSSE